MSGIPPGLGEKLFRPGRVVGWDLQSVVVGPIRWRNQGWRYFAKTPGNRLHDALAVDSRVEGCAYSRVVERRLRRVESDPLGDANRVSDQYERLIGSHLIEVLGCNRIG